MAVASFTARQHYVWNRGQSGLVVYIAETALMTDAVEKVGPSIGIHALGYFPPRLRLAGCRVLRPLDWWRLRRGRR
jgi:hypothetical protein